MGKNNPKHDYFIGDGTQRVTLEETDLEKDLGVFLDPELDFKSHIKKTVQKASYTSFKILKNLTYRDSNILVPLFKSLVRPILEYGNTVWSMVKWSKKIYEQNRKCPKTLYKTH